MCDFWARLTDHTPHILRRVVTLDEAWIYMYDPQFREQAKEWLRPGEPRPQQAHREIATGKVMIVTFFDARGLIYFEYIQRPLTCNQHVFRAVLIRFHEAYMRRRPHSSIRGRRFLHMDNAPPPPIQPFSLDASSINWGGHRSLIHPTVRIWLRMTFGCTIA